MTTRWSRLGTELFEGMQLPRIAFVGRGVGSCKERNLLGCSEAVAFDGGCDIVKAEIIQVLAAGWPQEDGLSTTVNIATMQVTNTHMSDSPPLRDSRGVNVLEKSAAHALTDTKRADVVVKICWYILADAGIDGECHAFPLIYNVNAELDVSQGLLGRKNRQCLGFTAVDIERAAEVTYSSDPALHDLIGGSIDCDDEDSADGGEHLSRKHHGVG